jgi:hypothetical protein
VGWVKWDGDEFHGFIYLSPSEISRRWQRDGAPDGFIPVFANREDAKGA